MRYQFRKLYADLVTEDGTVCVLYWTQSVFLGMKQPRIGLELYWPDGRTEILQASTSDGLPPESRQRLSLQLPDGPFVYEFDVRHDHWSSAPNPSDSLDWSIQFARADVQAKWLCDPQRPTLSGTGYADRVTLLQPLRRLGLERVDWGRIHTQQHSLVFNVVHFANGTSWSKTICWPLDGPVFMTDAIDFEQSEGRTHIGFPGHTVRLEPERVLHSGPAIAAERFPNSMDRSLTRAIAGPIEETRWLGQARISNSRAEDTGWAVYEQVHFGRGAHS